jgi:Flp pilus assembly protein TadD/outer membrane protein OmpA-like peptidoglycan-associated protein
MKKQSIKGLAFIAIAGMSVASCDILKDLDYKVENDPLELHGDSVRVKVDVTFPEKGLHKKATAEITPMIGTHALKTITVKGEKSAGNGEVIEYKPGGKITYTDVIAYSPDMEVSKLTITGKGSKGSKEQVIDPVDIADATIITPLRIQNEDIALIGADAFQRVTEEVFSAQINFAKGKSNVTSSEMKQDDIKSLGTFLAEAQNNVKVSPKKINLVSYASPEGEVAKNQDLAADRAKTAQDALISFAKGKKVGNVQAQTGDIYTQMPKGEDWDGFKADLMKIDDNKISADEKDRLIRIVEMTSDKQEREKQIQNLAATYKTIEKDILPKLRRSKINVVYDLTGYSDEELKAISKMKPDSLTVEELLFTATLTDDLEEKLRLYKEVEKIYPNDWRGSNNVGYIYFVQNKLGDAKTQFEKSNGIQENPFSLNNLGIIARINGDRATAKELLARAGEAGSDVNKNIAIIDILEGNYEAAVGKFGSDASFNKALAQLLAGNAEAAKSTLNSSDAKETAMGHYLAAIISARQDNETEAVSSLKSAFAKDAALKATAAKDAEFIKFTKTEGSALAAILK